ncbi:hypothetical protein E2C01_014420 [Portunus trituberculatus]|uniref:Uncharacterized protein n=1 Tax=Portunus trituberculatus TaxID=210409 RepID=A0A5B7DK22_PORTR|nr:hypothetical protein [Portunus trituberculatus]
MGISKDNKVYTFLPGYTIHSPYIPSKHSPPGRSGAFSDFSPSKDPAPPPPPFEPLRCLISPSIAGVKGCATSLGQGQSKGEPHASLNRYFS